MIAASLVFKETAVAVKKQNQYATCIPIEIEIEAGNNNLKAWFKDADGNDNCGAYYLRVKKNVNM